MTCLCGDSECPSCGLLQGTLTTCHCCGERPAIAGEELCHSCRDNESEAAYERAQEEPCFRGGEWAAAQAAEAVWIRRNLK